MRSLFFPLWCILFLSTSALAELERIELKVDGVMRTAWASAPEHASAQKSPLIFVWHGHGGNAQRMAKGFALHAHWPDAVVLYPQGLLTPGFYDPEGKRSGWQKGPGAQGNRDLAFFDQLLGYAKKKWKIDEERIHATGHSNGGGFTYLLLFERGESLASVAPSSAGVSRDLRGRKPPARPIFHLIGETDRIVPPRWQDPVIGKIKEFNECGEGKPWNGHSQCKIFPSTKNAPLVVYRHPGGHRMPGDSAKQVATFFRQHPKPGKVAKTPNILIILADDLGYSDLGCYGGEIETPNLDALAKDGLRFSQFYNTARCWPTRASMMTGYYAQQVNRDKIAGRKFAGNRGGRPSWAKLLPELLKPAGYRSYHSGKWHIDGKPMQTGFDRSYNISNHGFFRLKFHYLDGVKQGPTKVSDDFYVTDAIADHAVEILREHGKKHAESPFMHFLAFTAPHFPLHAKPADIERYRKRYREGWDEMRAKRHARQKELGFGFGELSEVERKVGPPYDFPDAYKILGEGEVKYPDPWDGLTDAQKNFQADKMAAHSAMVDSMDQGIGRVLEQIKKMGAWEDTLVLFLSDNGASAEIMVRGDGHDPKAPWASAYTYLCLGPGWSTVSNTPFRMHKTWVHEGGACTPLVAHWPKGIQGKGRISDRVGHVIDLVPTVLDLAGLPADKKAGPDYPGTSLAPVLKGKEQAQPRDLWWAHDGHRAYRSGDWKIVSKKGKGWELYDLGEDRTERKDLAGSKKEKVKQLADKWEKTVDGFVEDLKN